MHGVHESVLEAQAAACGLRLIKVPLPDPCTDEEYREAIAKVVAGVREEGVRAVAFGDLYLADVRAYREVQLAGTGITPLFPLWERPTAALAQEMVAAGVKAIITCVDTEQLDRTFLGRVFDRELLAELPESVDPCAENGEFHTAVVGGPMFRKSLVVEAGAVVDRGRFVWMDLHLAQSNGLLSNDIAPAQGAPETR